jgi:hemolysin III
LKQSEKKQMSTYTHKQEFVNGLIHGFGMIFGISCLPVLTAIAAAHNNVHGVVGAGIYGFCFLLLFSASTLYHLVPERRAKRVLEILDHISIYFLIAGTYTPFILIYMYNTFGLTLLVTLWVLALCGIVFKSMLTGKFDVISTGIYLLMGWAIIVGGRRFFDAMPTDVVVMVATGGVLYTVGVIFYLWDKHMYTHALWHGIVLAAAICHYVAVLLAM